MTAGIKLKKGEQRATSKVTKLAIFQLALVNWGRVRPPRCIYYNANISLKSSAGQIKSDINLIIKFVASTQSFSYLRVPLRQTGLTGAVLYQNEPDHFSLFLFLLKLKLKRDYCARSLVSLVVPSKCSVGCIELSFFSVSIDFLFIFSFGK